MRRRKFSKSKPFVNKQPNKVTPVQNQKPSVINNNSPSVGGMIGQGMALGAGAAIGNTMINGVMNTISGTEEKKDTNVDNTSTFNCSKILDGYRNCMYSSNDITLCRQQLELFNMCIESNKN